METTELRTVTDGKGFIRNLWVGISKTSLKQMMWYLRKKYRYKRKENLKVMTWYLLTTFSYRYNPRHFGCILLRHEF